MVGQRFIDPHGFSNSDARPAGHFLRWSAGRTSKQRLASEPSELWLLKGPLPFGADVEKGIFL
ncbi:hypothetical protein HNR13_001221 [Leifsonia shinshuensis]|uniref:Uncharacterized protein n=1 Tax=Leifsonia shinshuensis TaxID=150026 RepID=A0A853CUQ4_9MICO|nr:hypothetical protein [Leifsonia shinshuensis]